MPLKASNRLPLYYALSIQVTPLVAARLNSNTPPTGRFLSLIETSGGMYIFQKLFSRNVKW